MSAAVLLVVTQPLLKIKIEFMPNHIDCQLRVQGPAASIQKMITEITYYTEGHYCVDLGCFTSYNEDYVRLYPECTNLEENTIYINEEKIPDFEFFYQGAKTYYEWLGDYGYIDPFVWVEPTWHRLSVSPEGMIVNFTAAWYPPLVSIIYGSTLFSDLNFRFAFRDLSDMCDFGGIEGMNGVFRQIPQSGHIDSLTGRNVYYDYERGWCYYEDHTCCINQVAAVGVDFIDYEESNVWDGTKNDTTTRYDIKIFKNITRE